MSSEQKKKKNHELVDYRKHPLWNIAKEITEIRFGASTDEDYGYCRRVIVGTSATVSVQKKKKKDPRTIANNWISLKRLFHCVYLADLTFN